MPMLKYTEHIEKQLQQVLNHNLGDGRETRVMLVYNDVCECTDCMSVYMFGCVHVCVCVCGCVVVCDCLRVVRNMADACVPTVRACVRACLHGRGDIASVFVCVCVGGWVDGGKDLLHGLLSGSTSVFATLLLQSFAARILAQAKLVKRMKRKEAEASARKQKQTMKNMYGTSPRKLE